MAEKKHSLLIVDDEPENLRALRRVFRREYNVHMADGGAAALELMDQSNSISCVISDQRMPEMTGVELLSHVRDRSPLTVRMILTGYTDVEDIIASINDGHIYKFITKPWTREDIAVTVQRALDHYEDTLRVRTLLKELERKNQELLKLDRMKSEFMTIASHELRTPLVKITGYTELLTRGSVGELNPKQQKFVKVVLEGAHRLADITNHIMDATRLELPEVQLEMSELNLEAMLATIESEMTPFALQREQAFSLEVEPGLPTIRGSETELHKALINVVMNAIRFTPDNGSITVKAARSGTGVELSITDTGIGIEAEHHERVFEKFYAVKSSDYHFSGTFEFMSGGMGLGLAIARKLLEAHGGSITVSSRLGEGSTFRIQLPAA